MEDNLPIRALYRKERQDLRTPEDRSPRASIDRHYADERSPRTSVDMRGSRYAEDRSPRVSDASSYRYSLSDDRSHRNLEEQRIRIHEDRASRVSVDERSRSSRLERMDATGRSSISSLDSESHTNVMSMSKRWTTLETVGRCMFLLSVAFFIVGVLITVFGFSNTGIGRRQQIPLQILGPTCLAMTVVMWIIGCVFSRLWNMEWKRQQHAINLRDRVQLHALAMDILNNPVISPGMLQDPVLRRQLLHKLRAQKTLDMGYVLLLNTFFKNSLMYIFSHPVVV